ncbi:hypothetical protein VTN77DRAFT_3851 [Rasamsonia byssochlamydoides]|uniref:uncharacterized protein n=1 Tax=Rasamsonia byssochlamydoides TaxID=89139 RepID=UPI003743F385
MDSLETEHLISDLTDLDLAVLLSLIAQEHCLIETTSDCIDDVSKELALICQNTFGLSYALLDCSEETSLDDFSTRILAPDPVPTGRQYSPSLTRHAAESRYPSFKSAHGIQEHSMSVKDNYLDERKVVNVVIAKNFNRTRDDIQIQALELLRSRRIFTKTAVHGTPKVFLFIAVIASDESSSRKLPLNRHLNDHLFLSHVHEPQHGYPNLEDDDSWISDDRASISSVVRKSRVDVHRRSLRQHKIDEEMISKLRLARDNVFVSAEVARYLQNIVVFLRLNRAVAGGISAKATNHFLLLAKSLAPLHGINYLTPSIVALAAKKIYRHRIIVASAENERSIQYGSNLNAVSQLLRDVNSDAIIDKVIGEVEAPL